jgi:hypothetical protein
MPIRVQLSRKKGWKMPSNTVKVDRSTLWGNPFNVVKGRVLRGGAINWYTAYFVGSNLKDFAFKEEAVAVSIRSFEKWIQHPAQRKLRDLIKLNIGLRGKNLACWCKLDQPCHADTLLEIANSKE